MSVISKLVTIGAAGASGGQSYWLATLGGTGSDESSDVKTDADGNVYVCGKYYAGGPSYAFVAKYDTDGNLLWQRYVEFSNAYSVAVDASSNVYIAGPTGTGSGDLVVVKFNSSGTLQWQKSFYVNARTYPHGMDTDSSGNLYIAGLTSSTDAGGDGDTDADMWLMKVNSSGVIQWQKQYDYNTDYIYGLTVDGSANVYLAGSYSNSARAYIAKIDTSGTVLWEKYFGNAAYNDFNDVAVDGSGNVYVVGNSSNVSTYDSIVIVKFNSSGILQWQRGLSWVVGVGGSGIDVDSAGDVYVCGWQPSYRIFVAKYSSGGTLQWQNELNGSGNEGAVGLVIDASDNVCVAGTTSSAGAGSNDILLVKLPNDGSLTGTYSGITYANSSLTDAATPLASGPASLTAYTTTATFSTSSYASGNPGLTSTVTVM